ncbi:30S ribosomal protein S8 [Patescibacteria group bacterium]|nr:30S ribosomal protein S8 [Patescibacteria group bacterium]MBU2220003.1 30S ribosomal protein S8 [Patescibacteria group bacterium]MBU2264559.1 30S ribosomal protein S8 [Patescibacteria group bacterium]
MDPIADLLVRIKNAQAAGRETTEAPFSNVKMAVVKILAAKSFIEGVEKKGVKNKEKLEIKLKYDQGIGAIAGIKRVSRPGQRRYSSSSKLRPSKQGYGLMIISTSQGIMSGQDAKKKKIGGEVLCEIW